MSKTSRIPQLYRLSLESRCDAVIKCLELSDDSLHAFSPQQGLCVEAADAMIENAIGVFGLPVGVAANFIVDGAPVLVPMAIEEPSVVAAASHMAKLAAATGGFTTCVDESIMIGQIQILDVPDIDHALSELKAHENALIAFANTFCTNMVGRGGGCVEMRLRVLPATDDELANRNPMLVVHVHIDVCDAMGANIVNTVMEGLGPKLAALTLGRLGFCILSNLADQRLARASCRIPYRLLATDDTNDNGRNIASRIMDGYIFACRDPYRAATHNKGVMNGIDAVAMATGNDWRAIEAGAHAFASKSGRYSSLTRYALNDELSCLDCSIELPMAVGIVGGCAPFHPTVAASLEMLGPFGRSATKLAGLLASVGLAQNLGALRALACEGIQQGHMALHRRKKDSSRNSQ